MQTYTHRQLVTLAVLRKHQKLNRTQKLHEKSSHFSFKLNFRMFMGRKNTESDKPTSRCTTEPDMKSLTVTASDMNSVQLLHMAIWSIVIQSAIIPDNIRKKDFHTTSSVNTFHLVAKICAT